MGNNDSFFHKPLTRSIGLVFSGHILAAVLGALSIFLASRKFSVGEFGLFSVCLAFIRYAPLFTTFGLDTTTMKFASSFLRDDKKTEAAQVIRAMFSFRTTTAAALMFIIFFSAAPLAERLFHAPRLAPLLKIASVGVLAATLFNYLKAVLWSYQLFKKSVVLQILIDAAKLSITALLFLFGWLTPAAAVGLFGLVPFLGIFLGRSHIPEKFFSKRDVPPHLIFQLSRFSRWIYASDICRASHSAVDIFLVMRLLGDKAAGLYGLADNLTYLFPILAISLKAVLLPAVSRFSSREQFEKYIRQALKVSLFAGAACLPVLLFSKPLILTFFGSRYSESVPVFNVLFLASLVGTLQSAFHAPVYALHKPLTLAILDASRFIVTATLTYKAIPVIGLMAAPFILLAVNASSLTFLVAYTRRTVRHLKF